MAQTLAIKIYPDSALRLKNRQLKPEELQAQEFKQLILDMEKTMQEKDGVGLAAPQVGKNIQLAVIKTDQGTLVLINPKILRRSLKKEEMEEGCLSLPEIFGLVKRPIKIKLTALDASGKKMKFVATGYFARVIQHEVDHLNGILIIDRTKDIIKGKENLENMEHKT